MPRTGIHHGSKSKTLLLLTASLISSLIMLDSNIVAVALPTIARSLNATFTDIEWVVSAYILTFAALLLAAGSYADRHGRKRAMLIGLGIFIIASALCGFATSAHVLNWARALQGIGGSLLLTSALAVINHAFVGADRAKAYAFWGTCLGIAITSGPIVGGVITDWLGWRWAFLINLPVGFILFIAAAKIIDESRDPDAKSLDIAGILTFSCALFLLIWALIDGNNVGWATTVIIWRLVGAALLFIAFAVVEVRQKRPMVDFSLFRNRTFLGATFAMLGYAAGAQVLVFFLPLFLQIAYGLAPSSAGFAMLPFALPMFLTPLLGARLAGRYSGRTLLTLGLVVSVFGDVLLSTLAASEASYAFLVIGMLVAGAGAGLLNGETAKVMQGAVPAQRAGMGSGLTATVRFVGLLLGVVSLGALLSKEVSRHFIASSLSLGLDPNLAASFAKRVAAGDFGSLMIQLPTSLHEPVQAAATKSFVSGFAAASALAAITAATAGILTYVLVRRADTAPAVGGHESAVAAME